MLKAPVPANEQERYLDLLRYQILDTEEEEDYSSLIELAAEICDCTSATITFIDKDRQWFKAGKNIPGKEGPRDISFCGHVILHEEVMVVNNTAADDRFADNPDVIDGLRIGFYAGAPIISSDGYKLGTVCVIDQQPKKSLSAEQVHSLEIIAAQVTRLLELRMKNRLIAEQANALLDAEKDIARLNMQLTEKQNSHIAYELHENIAQILAAAKMMVEGNTDPLDEKENEKLTKYLSLVLEDVKALSYSITPTTFAASDYKNFIWELAQKTKAEKNINIRFDEGFPKIALKETIGLTAFRIFQCVIEYAELSGASELEINLGENDNEISLILHHNGKDISKTEKGKMIINNMITRASIINGKFSHNADYSHMEVIFPR